MKNFLKFGAVTCLAALMMSGMAHAEGQGGERPPGFFDLLFGRSSHQRVDQPRTYRRYFGRQSEQDVAGPTPRYSRKAAKPDTAEDDPEADPGFGMGNLTYVPPKTVALSGIKLDQPRPGDASAGAIYDQLQSDGPSLRALPAARDALVAQYAAQGFRPIWLANGKLSERGAAVLKLLAAAAEEGLEPQSYLPTGLSAFDAPLPETDAAAMARLDIDLSVAALRYAHDASGGQFDPRLLSAYNDVTPPWIAPAQALKVIAFSPYAVDYLRSLHPKLPAYAAMKAELAKLRAAGSSAAKPIADGKIVKKGQSDARIPAVRDRLAELGYAAEPDAKDPELLDAALSDAMRQFQKASAIKVTGSLGPQTIGALNADKSRASAAKLVDNIERLRWLPRDMGSRYVFVNQPAFEAQVIDNGKEAWSTRVIVGKPNTQTAVFNDEMEFVVFNPSWGVPPSIIANEYLPKLRRDPSYLDREGFKVVTPGGKVVSSSSIDWASYGSKVPFGIQQPPGRKNALGELKFLFPNSHNIYMHDTPARELFSKDVRAFSHGCVRVQNPREFASVLLGWSDQEVAKHVESSVSQTVKLKRKLPVHLTYFTAWPDSTGKIHYFNDIYGRDKNMEAARTTTQVAQR